MSQPDGQVAVGGRVALCARLLASSIVTCLIGGLALAALSIGDAHRAAAVVSDPTPLVFDFPDASGTLPPLPGDQPRERWAQRMWVARPLDERDVGRTLSLSFFDDVSTTMTVGAIDRGAGVVRAWALNRPTTHLSLEFTFSAECNAWSIAATFVESGDATPAVSVEPVDGEPDLSLVTDASVPGAVVDLTNAPTTAPSVHPDEAPPFEFLNDCAAGLALPTTTAPWRPAAPDTTAPDTTAPDTTAPDTTAPDTTAPDTTAPDTTAPSRVAGSSASGGVRSSVGRRIQVVG